MDVLVPAIAAAITGIAGLLTGRLSRRKLSAEVTLAEVNAYEARINGLADMATTLTETAEHLRNEVQRLDNVVSLLQSDMIRQRDFYERHDAELHSSLAEEFERLAVEHRKHVERFGIVTGGL